MADHDRVHVDLSLVDALATRVIDMQGRGEVAANLLGQPLLRGENIVNGGLIDIGKVRRATAGHFHQMENQPDLRVGPPYAGLQ